MQQHNFLILLKIKNFYKIKLLILKFKFFVHYDFYCIFILLGTTHQDDKSYYRPTDRIQRLTAADNIPNYSTDIPLQTKQQNQHSNIKGKSSNHVCFNLNNAIYTTRQDTPIPISILKGTSPCYEKSSFKSTVKNFQKFQNNEIIAENDFISSTSFKNQKKAPSDNSKDIDANINTSISQLQVQPKYTKNELPKMSIL